MSYLKKQSKKEDQKSIFLTVFSLFFLGSSAISGVTGATTLNGVTIGWIREIGDGVVAGKEMNEGNSENIGCSKNVVISGCTEKVTCE